MSVGFLQPCAIQHNLCDMKVCVDIQSTIGQRAGVGRYTRMLVENLAPLCGDDELALHYFDFKHKGMPFDAPGAKRRPVYWFPGRGAQFLWKKYGRPSFNFFSRRAEVYHFPNFILPPLRRGKSVVTIHDMTFLRHPDFTEDKNLDYLSAKMKDTVERADAIITVSKFSGNEVIETMGVSPDKVHPIHLGIDSSFSPPTEEEIEGSLSALGLDRPYLLSVGTLEPRKNIPFIVDVFEKMQGDFDGWLVVAGMKGWKYEPILDRISSSPLADRIKYVEYVPDQQLRTLYAGAECFISASHYEGFGLPPLEAMACGTPVVSSCGGSLKEVLTGGALLFESYDAAEWASEIMRVISDGNAHEAMIEKGRAHARSYNWKRTAEQTWKVYREL